MTRLSFVRFFSFLVFVLIQSSLASADVWQETRQALQTLRTKNDLTYEKAVSALPLLIAKEQVEIEEFEPIQFGTMQSKPLPRYIIAGGLIVIEPWAIKSYSSPENFRNHPNEPEFTHYFSIVIGNSLSSQRESASSSASAQTLFGKKIALDLILSHPYFNDLQFESMSYSEFVVATQKQLRSSLEEKGAQVLVLRPDLEALTPTVFTELNETPPDVVISTQFNNDHQDKMVTFCMGGFSLSDLSKDIIRARFIVSALSPKPLESVQLGQCIRTQCEKNLEVLPLDWKDASFEGNAFPIPKSTNLFYSEEGDGYCDGIMTRNFILNRLSQGALVIPFPDMKWVQESIQKKGVSQFIKDYTDALVSGVEDYFNSKSLVHKHSE